MFGGAVSGFLAGLAFLTRLGFGRSLDTADFSRSIPFLPLVGLVLGLLLVLPFALGLFPDAPLVRGWLTVLGSLYLTRGLHLDGLADLADGMGNHLDPERFWVIVKDSRTGVFGASAVCLAVVGQSVLFGALYERGMTGAVVFAFVLGRAAIAPLCMVSRDLVRPGLGGLFVEAATPGRTAASCFLALVLGLALMPLKGFFLAVFFLAIGVFSLARLARKVGGINGDFLGASVVLGEIFACAACIVHSPI